MTVFLATAAVGYLALVGLVFAFQRSLLYFPDTDRPDLAEAGLAGIMAPAMLETADGLSLLAWYRPAQRPELPTLLYLHGNGGNIGHRAEKVRPYIEAGFGLLLAEYRGYGGNPGRPTETGLYADARAAVGFLRSQGVADGRLVLFGESLGTGVAVQMASEGAGAALVLESPPSSIPAVAQSRYPILPAYWLARDRFDTLRKIAAIRLPLLVIHGERDSIVPVRFGRAVFAAAPGPKEGRFIPEAGHNDLYDFGAAEAVLEFLRRLPMPPPAGSGS